jgi:hypothetical protein
MTPLVFASMFGRTKIVEQLKAHGASSTRRNLGIFARIAMCLAWLIRQIPAEKQTITTN